jgi:hypothetical protein
VINTKDTAICFPGFDSEESTKDESLSTLSLSNSHGDRLSLLHYHRNTKSRKDLYIKYSELLPRFTIKRREKNGSENAKAQIKNTNRCNTQ